LEFNIDSSNIKGSPSPTCLDRHMAALARETSFSTLMPKAFDHATPMLALGDVAVPSR
jgi:hypothetical protein